jgi:integrase
MRAAGNGADCARLRALIVILWRAGLRISEALDLAETDLDASRGAVLVRRGKGGRRREVGMDRWALEQLQNRCACRRSTAVRSTPAAPRSCRRDGTRRRSARRNSAPARARKPRHHLGLPTRHRQIRNHRHRLLTTSTSDLSIGRSGRPISELGNQRAVTRRPTALVSAHTRAAPSRDGMRAPLQMRERGAFGTAAPRQFSREAPVARQANGDHGC